MKQNETFLGEKREKREIIYYCRFCDYKCDIKFSFDRHILTSKHLKMTFETKNETNETKKEKKNNIINITCECGEICNSRTTLWRHKKICCKKELTNEILCVDKMKPETFDKDELIMTLIKQNYELIKECCEFKNIVLEISKNGITNNTTNNTNNSHNKTFNLQLFLNETCKDAMNIMDFVDSIKLQLSDLENIGKLGYVEGISNIIVKNLNALDITQRPIHCADKKRETMYIKDDNKWEKEDDQKKKIRKAIKRVATKNQRLIPKFKEEHPDCNKAASKFSDQYNKIIVESMGGSGDNDLEKEDKIIKNISKKLTIDKNMID
jgi:hypothetical protein